MCIAHSNHCVEDVVPGLLLHHDGVREHATVPADMSKRLCQLAIFAVKPVAGVMRDVKLAVRIVGQAMVAGFVVCAGAFHGGVVLRDMEIDGPWTQARA